MDNQLFTFVFVMVALIWGIIKGEKKLNYLEFKLKKEYITTIIIIIILFTAAYYGYNNELFRDGFTRGG